MNREILFRGKREDNNEWVHGSVVSFDDGRKSIMQSKAEVFIRRSTTTIRCNECYDVKSDTVGQFTGLTDKNGVKIFEGDIVEHTTFYSDDKVRTGIVEYVEDYGAFFIVGSGYSDNQMYAFCNFKVVGNVFDNPELLEGNKDE